MPASLSSTSRTRSARLKFWRFVTIVRWLCSFYEHASQLPALCVSSSTTGSQFCMDLPITLPRVVHLLAEYARDNSLVCWLVLHSQSSIHLRLQPLKRSDARTMSSSGGGGRVKIFTGAPDHSSMRQVLLFADKVTCMSGDW